MPAAEVEADAASELAVRQVGELLAAPWFPPVIDRRFLDFVVAEGRVPRLGDPRPPSAYRGFLLFQVLLLSGSEGIHQIRLRRRRGCPDF
jgi:hypothetical protein